MVTMSIHTEEPFAAALREYAASRGTSVNRTVQDLLAPILGLSAVAAKPNPFHGLCGALPKEKSEKFEKALNDQRRIDAEIWK